MLPSNATLLIIDVQEGLDAPYYGLRCNPEAEDRMAELLHTWRSMGKPVVHVQHLSTNPKSPLRPDLPGCQIKAAVKPADGEPLFQKHVNSAFIGTGLETYLKNAGIDTLVIMGLTTEHCISTSVRMAANLGFKTYVVSDATAAFDCHDHEGNYHDAETVHAISLATLNGEFATVLTSKEIVDQI